MAMIYVRTRPGRRAYYEGRVIPQDKFIPVTDDPYIRRLIDVWDDLEVEGAKATPEKPPEQQPAVKPTTPPVLSPGHEQPALPLTQPAKAKES